MRLKDKLNRMESGELFDIDDMSQQTEAHGNRLRNKSGKTGQQDKSKKSDEKSSI